MSLYNTRLVKEGVIMFDKKVDDRVVRYESSDKTYLDVNRLNLGLKYLAKYEYPEMLYEIDTLRKAIKHLG